MECDKIFLKRVKLISCALKGVEKDYSSVSMMTALPIRGG